MAVRPGDMARMTLAEIEQVASRLAAALEVIRSAHGTTAGAPATRQSKPEPNWRVGNKIAVLDGIGAKARFMRIAAGYSQQSLAKSAGLAVATVVVLETQDKASARTLEKIGAVLGSPLEAP